MTDYLDWLVLRIWNRKLERAERKGYNRGFKDGFKANDKPLDIERVQKLHKTTSKKSLQDELSECCGAPISEQGFCAECKEHAR